MTRRSVTFEFGLCGFGFDHGLFPELRLGFVRVWTCRGSIIGQMRHFQAALKAAKAAVMS